MEFGSKPPVSQVAATVARAASLSGFLQGPTVGALPEDMVEGLLVAAETTIIVQKATGMIDEQGVEAIRRKIADWGRETIDRMEKDGTAEKIREQHRERMEENLGTKNYWDGGPN